MATMAGYEGEQLGADNMSFWGSSPAFHLERIDKGPQKHLAWALLNNQSLGQAPQIDKIDDDVIRQLRTKADVEGKIPLVNMALRRLEEIMVLQREDDARRHPGWQSDWRVTTALDHANHRLGDYEDAERIRMRQIIARLINAEQLLAEGENSASAKGPFAFQIPKEWGKEVADHYKTPADFELTAASILGPEYASAAKQLMYLLYGAWPVDYWEAAKDLFAPKSEVTPANEAKEKIAFTYFVDQWSGCQGNNHQPKPQEDAASVVTINEPFAENSLQVTLADGHGYPHGATTIVANTAIERIPHLTRVKLNALGGQQNDLAREIAVSQAVGDTASIVESKTELNHAGAAVATALIVPQRESIVKANVGDVKDYLIINGKPVLKSGVHNIDEGTDEEKQRLQEAGCVIEKDGVYWKPAPDSREKIQLTRAVGDKGLKDQVDNYAFTSTPDLIVIAPEEYRETQALFDFSDGIENALDQVNTTFEKIFTEEIGNAEGDVKKAVLATHQRIKDLVSTVETYNKEHGIYMDNATMVTVLVPHPTP